MAEIKEWRENSNEIHFEKLNSNINTIRIDAKKNIKFRLNAEKNNASNHSEIKCQKIEVDDWRINIRFNQRIIKLII